MALAVLFLFKKFLRFILSIEILLFTLRFKVICNKTFLVSLYEKATILDPSINNHIFFI